MNYTGKIIVRNDEGVVEEHSWGTLNKLLCQETTGDGHFTFGEMRFAPGGGRGPVQGHEAFHCLEGLGTLRVWLPCAGDAEPVSLPLRPGSEYYVRGDVPRAVESDGPTPIFGISSSVTSTGPATSTPSRTGRARATTCTTTAATSGWSRCGRSSWRPCT